VLCTGETCIELKGNESLSLDNNEENCRLYTLNNGSYKWKPSIEVSNKTSIEPFHDTLIFNAFTIKDSLIYLCTTDGVYFNTILSFFNDHILDFFIGRWGRSRDLTIEADRIYYYGIKDKEGVEMIVQFSCGEYYTDSAGEWKERIPQLTFKTEKVKLMNEIDTSLAFNGFEIKGDSLVIDGNSIPIHEVYVLRNNCVNSDFQNLILINRCYLLIKWGKEYILKSKFGMLQK